MEERTRWGELFRIYTPEEARQRFFDLRDRIFFTDDGGGDFEHSSRRVFRDPDWIRVIIRGSLSDSDRSKRLEDDNPDHPVTEDELKQWRADDPRDELQPLFDVLLEDGIDEIIHVSPILDAGQVQIVNEDAVMEPDAVGAPPTRDASISRFSEPFAHGDVTRLMFDRTGRWGFYASPEHFGLLGGEPAFMMRYVEKAGGMQFIREKADDYWQHVVDVQDYEAPYVQRYYELAGWSNPPRKRTSSQS